MFGNRNEWGFAWGVFPSFLHHDERELISSWCRKEQHTLFSINQYGPRWEYAVPWRILDLLFTRGRMDRVQSMLQMSKRLDWYVPRFFNSVVRGEGMDLEPHNDTDDAYPLRRYVLIVYLNQCWREEWGGGLRLYRSERNAQRAYSSALIHPWPGSAVVMEINDRSWHSVDANLHGANRHAIVGWLHEPGREGKNAAKIEGAETWVPGDSVLNHHLVNAHTV